MPGSADKNKSFCLLIRFDAMQEAIVTACIAPSHPAISWRMACFPICCSGYLRSESPNMHEHLHVYIIMKPLNAADVAEAIFTLLFTILSRQQHPWSRDKRTGASCNYSSRTSCISNPAHGYTDGITASNRHYGRKDILVGRILRQVFCRTVSQCENFKIHTGKPPMSQSRSLISCRH